MPYISDDNNHSVRPWSVNEHGTTPANKTSVAW